MSEYQFGLLFSKPSRASAKAYDRICREEGGYGFKEVNVTDNAQPWINDGAYQGWFTVPNRGVPYDQKLATRILEKCAQVRP